jgi:hypothetical protein
MFHKLFRASAERQAAEAETRRVCKEIRQEKDKNLRETYRDLDTTQEILERIDVKRASQMLDQPM